MRRKLLVLVAVFAASFCFGASETKPNVVILYTDDQGTLDANCYGSKDLYTPTIDKLAKTGIKFTQAYAHTVCAPSRASLFTGRHPHRSGIIELPQGNRAGKKGANMAIDEVTLAEVFKENGYRTGLFGKWHLGAKKGHGPLSQGFDQFFGFLGGFIGNYTHYFLHKYAYHDLYDGDQEIFRKGEYFPGMMTEKALEFIDENREKPFFMCAAFNLPHYPEQSDKKFDERYKDIPMPRRSYAKVVSTVDDLMGKIVSKLEALGLRENTIILFMSDNGYSTENSSIKNDNHPSGYPKGFNYGANKGGGNTGKWLGCKATFYEGGIRVPCVLSYPAKLPQNVSRDQAVLILDWYPTLLELCGIDQPDVKLDGKSIVPILTTENAESEHKLMYWAWQRKWCVREGDWKLIGIGPAPQMLVNIADAEPEKTNYLNEKPELAQTLFGKLQTWQKQTMTEDQIKFVNSSKPKKKKK